MSKQKLERVLQLMINEENDKATDLLHDIFVEKARNIYSNMIKEDEDLERTLSERDDEFDFDISDMEDDLEDDLEMEMEDYDSEIDADEMYEADDDEDMDMDMDMDDAEMDLEDEMSDDDMGMEMDDEPEMDMDDEVEMPTDAEEAFMNVDDALDELKAYFADIAGDDSEEEDEFDTDDYEYDEDGAEDLEAEFGDDEDEDELKESAHLKKVSEPKAKENADGKDTVFKNKIKRDVDGKSVPAFQQSDEQGGTAPKPKDLGVDGPQENAGKLRKMKG